MADFGIAEIALIVGAVASASATGYEVSNSMDQQTQAKKAADEQIKQQRALQQQFQTAQASEQQKQDDIMKQARARQRALAAASLTETRGGTILTSPQGTPGASSGSAQPYTGTQTLLGAL